MSLEALIAKARLGFQQRYGEPCSHVAWAPGRINLIGEHTDYTGGLCMPAAIDRHVVCAIRPISAPFAHFYSVSYTEELDLPLPVRDAPTEGWGAYAAGAVAVFQEALVQAGRSIGRGVEVLILGDVPLGARRAPVEVAFQIHHVVLDTEGLRCHVVLRACRRDSTTCLVPASDPRKIRARPHSRRPTVARSSRQLLACSDPATSCRAPHSMRCGSRIAEGWAGS